MTELNRALQLILEDEHSFRIVCDFARRLSYPEAFRFKVLKLIREKEEQKGTASLDQVQLNASDVEALFLMFKEHNEFSMDGIG